MNGFNAMRLLALVAVTTVGIGLVLARGAWAEGPPDGPVALGLPDPILEAQALGAGKGDGWGTQVDPVEAAALEVLAQLPQLGSSPAQSGGVVSSCDASKYCRSPVEDRRCYIADFPEVQWQFCAVDMRKRGLWIEHVRLRRTPGSTPIDVLFEAGVMDLFVPYHNGQSRAHDMEWCYSEGSSAGNCQQTLDSAVVGGFGIVEDFTNAAPARSSVAVETRDGGLAHLCTGPFGDVVRRRSEVAVWAVFDPGNYDNVIEYTFRNDGSMGFRSGVSGYNHPQYQLDGHMHNTLWRVDMDLNGYTKDTAHLSRHVESGLTATDDEVLFGGGWEGFAYWAPHRFTTLIVEDAATNAHGRHLGYEMQPLRTGTARHFGPDEAWTHMDFGVTRYQPGEPNFADSAYTKPAGYLMSGGQGVSNKEPIVDQDLVLWHMSSAHHSPHDEDKSTTDGPNQFQGITQMHWSGFDLVPHNLFDHNPLGGPEKCGN